jgi:GT2 family glycosyltransferase
MFVLKDAYSTLTLVMPTIGWEEPFGGCVRAALAGLGPLDEALVVFDGTPSPAPEWLRHSRAGLLNTGERSGPAAARNLAARTAHGEILVFVDADVELHPDALERIRAQFANDPELAAVFGSYDDRPSAPGVVSRFRNLLHHHTHSSHPGPATTFWAGCGAVRRQTFLDLGGFDAETYDRPCIEDIEFGLRLSDAGGRILLDPAIQGTHHKCWTLRTTVVTDIRQRAVPWSELLLRRSQLSTTLNLNPAARVSAAASLLLPCALLAALIPVLRPWCLALGSGCLVLLLALNRQFYGLLLRRCGPLEAVLGIGLHGLYLTYSSISFGLVAVHTSLQQPLRLPAWLESWPGLRRRLVVLGLILLGLLSLATIGRGLLVGWLLGPNDLQERFVEWQLFQQGVYPAAHLATPLQRALTDFRTTVYLPWALPMFGLLFAWGGMQGGTLLIHALSLLSLLLIAAIGWRSLSPWGRCAGWLGALAPLAINGNNTALQNGQFSIICMGLISLQWLLLLRNRPLPAGFCWALAMVKPQVAVTFALSFLGRSRWVGLVWGLGLLCGLTAVALAHTHSHPYAYLLSWLQTLSSFAGKANLNVAYGLVDLFQRSAAQVFFVMAAIVVVVMGALIRVGGSRLLGIFQIASLLQQADPLLLAGVCSVVGQLAFYHRHYDNFMLYPVLLAAFRLALCRLRFLDLLLATLMAASVWAPQRLVEALPGSAILQAMIWLWMGIIMLRALWIDSTVAVGPRTGFG